jgi:hypothetical protein
MTAPGALYGAVLDSSEDQVAVLCRDHALLRYTHDEFDDAMPLYLGVVQVGDRVGLEGGAQFCRRLPLCTVALNWKLV